MIRRVRVTFVKSRCAWTEGVVREASPLVVLEDKEVIFDKEYKGESTYVIWNEIRRSIAGYFFDIFYPSVVWRTLPPSPPTEDPLVALRRQTKHIRERQSILPEYYIWNPRLKKWHMSLSGYVKQVKDRGGPIEMSVSPDGVEEYGPRFLDMLQERYKGQKVKLFIFIYPDRYDQEIRAMFDLEVWFA